MKQRLATTLCIFALAMGVLSSCHSSHTAARGQKTALSKITSHKHAAPKQHDNIAKPDAHGSKLLEEAYDWLGTPYLYGGNDRNGVDCSGFVLQVYLNAECISLPRTSAQQAEWCQRADTAALEVGDLVFFAVSDPARVNHVGMYVGDGKMIHASSSRGVVIDPMDGAFWRKHLHSAGRVHGYAHTQPKKEHKSKPKSESSPITKSSSPQPPAKPVESAVEAPAPDPASVVKNAFAH